MASPPKTLGSSFAGFDGSGTGGIVDEHYQGLSPDVHPFVVVPIEFRRLHAIADKQQRRVFQISYQGPAFASRQQNR